MTSKTGSRLRKPDPRGGRPSIEDGGLPEKAYPVADVQPLDVTGVRTVAVGTCLWLVTFLALIPFYSGLRDSGRGWWLWTCLAGVGLGLFALEYCRRRRDRLAAQPKPEVETSPLGAAGL